MKLDHVSPGTHCPDQINVIIEIPAYGQPIKYEVDKKTGAMFVDRFMSTAMYYPCNYGYVPNTLSQDSDPVDVLVITPIPLMSGAVICCRPVGMLRMTDESGIDTKILAVPIDKLTSIYHHVHEYGDLQPELLKAIVHFFEHYKDLEPNKWVKVGAWEPASAAKIEITESIERFEKNT